MSTISKERLLKIQTWRETYGPGSNVVLPADEAEELARIAQASLEAEAVAWRYRHHNGLAPSNWRFVDSEGECNKAPNYQRQALYTASPAPVAIQEDRYQNLSELYHAQEKRLFKLAQRIKGPSFDKYAHSPSQAIDVLESAIFGERKEDCRAAMLQGTEPVSNRDELPHGWVACSERMPDKLIPVMVMYADAEMWSAIWTGTKWDDGTEFPDPHAVTHWQEMPAAPQQEAS